MRADVGRSAPANSPHRELHTYSYMAVSQLKKKSRPNFICIHHSWILKKWCLCKNGGSHDAYFAHFKK